jgi:hypothetical protein
MPQQGIDCTPAEFLLFSFGYHFTLFFCSYFYSFYLSISFLPSFLPSFSPPASFLPSFPALFFLYFSCLSSISSSLTLPPHFASSPLDKSCPTLRCIPRISVCKVWASWYMQRCVCDLRMSEYPVTECHANIQEQRALEWTLSENLAN